MEVEKAKGVASEPPSKRRREDETKDTMDTEIPIPQAETEGEIDPNTAGSDSRGGEKRKSECGEEPPSTRVQLQALADSLHSVSEGNNGGCPKRAYDHRWESFMIG